MDMRYKHLPPAPESVDAILAVQRAIPLVPAPELDCCVRVMDRTGVASRDRARTWITFLQALGLVEEADQGFVRRHNEYSVEELGNRFVTSVYGAREVIEVLAGDDAPVPSDRVIEKLEGSMPTWERQQDTGASDRWRERTEQLLEWLVVLGRIERTPTGYTTVSPKNGT